MKQATDSLEAAPGPSQIPVGTVIGGRFRIEALLAREGATHLYRAGASDGTADGAWTVRIVPFSAIPQGPSRLLAELERVKALRHKNLVDLLGAGREADFVYAAWELVDGQTLRSFIDGKRAEGRGVSLKGTSNLVAHVANALEYAASQPGGPAHGALSPATILVNRAGRVKVTDLALAAAVPSIARRGAPAGVPDTLYTAPELLPGAPATAAADVYALGAILYELLTGRAATSPIKPASSLVADVPASIDAAIERAMSRNPQARFPSTAALKEAVQSAANPSGVRITETSGLATLPTGPGDRPSGGAHAAAASAGGGRPSAPLLPAAPASQVSPSGERLTLGRSFDVASAAGSAADDTHEHWLIQKDRLDFGPFSLAQIRAQIERGEILADHIIVDSDSGSRSKIKEFPALAEFTKAAHRRLEQTRRAHAEHRSERSEKKKSMVTFLIVSSVVLVVGAAVGLYVYSRRDSEGSRLASRQEETEIDNFLKGVKIGGMKASVRRAARRPGGGGGGPDEFSNDMNIGDVTKGMNEGDAILDDDQIQSTMMSNYRKLVPCIAQAGVSEVNLEFVVRGTGKVSAVKVNGQKSGGLPSCVLARMQSFSFPHFNGNKTIASWSMSMRR